MSQSLKISDRVFKSSLLNIVGIPSLFFVITVLFIHFQSASMMRVYYDSEDLTETKLLVSEYFRQYLDMETSLRGYSISGNALYLEPFIAANKVKDQYQDEIFQRLLMHEGLSDNYKKLIAASEDWYTYNFKIVEKLNSGLYTKKTREAARVKFDLIRKEFKEFNDLLDQRKAEFKNRAEDIKKVTLYSELIIAFMFVVFLYILLKKQVRNLVSSYKNLLQNNEEQYLKIEETSNAKDLFLANMSHEIRTPLGAILGFVELALEDKSLNQETKNHLSFVNRNGIHLLNLVEDLFDLSKVGSNKLDINLDQTDLLELLKDLKKMFSSNCENSKVKLEFLITENIARCIRTDAVRLKQILTNLISNSIKFSKQGDTVNLIISKDGDCLIFDVKDQGLGIAEEKQSVIFTAFEQAETQHSRNFGGAGLGLSISKNLASLMKGDLELVSSQKDVGSHFRAKIPLEQMNDDVISQKDLIFETESEAKVPKSKKVTFEFLKGKRILLAEDSKENQVLFKIYLESEGLFTDIVETGADAIKKAFNENYDLILMDIQMPVMDGYEALKILKDSKYDKKVIALTAHAIAGEKEKCIKFGFDSYLSKPISKINLLSAIQDIILSELDS